ncbi:MAG: helix-turn-helix domain-containing protein [Eubacterium sp.]
MPRSYKHISDYEKEIMEMWNKGNSLREIANELGFTYKQIRNFKYRYNTNKRKTEAGKVIHKKGRPCKKQDGDLPPSIQKLDKLAQMRYVMASKDRYIKLMAIEECIYGLKGKEYTAIQRQFFE